MAEQCPHNDKLRKVGACAKCSTDPAYMVFRWNKDCTKTGDDDRCCGYFWGSERKELAGQKARW